MTQYQTSGPPPREKDMVKDHDSEISNLKDLVAQQGKKIDKLEKDLRKIRNDMRTAIDTINITNSNHRNG